MPVTSTRLESEVRQLLEDEGIVLLEFSLKGHARRLALRVIADRRRGGLTIDDCVHLSRQIQFLIRERKLLADDYHLEVSSPGLDYPMRDEWQFVKNIGRLVKVTVPGEKGPREISGRMTTADGDGVVLTAGDAEWRLRYSDLLSARVLPEFKPPRME